MDSFIKETNEKFINLNGRERVSYALEHFPGRYALSSSFGVQSAVSLHMLTEVYPDIPVILIDTGYLFPETHQFVEQLTERLDLNLHVYQSQMSNKIQEAKFGKQWEQTETDLKAYNQMNKVEPMERALEELGIGTWFAGVRKDQSQNRGQIPFVQRLRNKIKVHPLLDLTNQHLHKYLTKHNLPYHPLWDKGYVSVGDTHSTVPLTLGMTEADTRFGGRSRECGLHIA